MSSPPSYLPLSILLTSSSNHITNTAAIIQAALHRDGEQARLIAQVRQRQLQAQQETSTMQWIHESFWEFVNAFYEERKQFDRHEHYADIINPRRDGRRSDDGGGVEVTNVKRVSDDTLEESTQPRPLLLRGMVLLCERILHILRWIVDKIMSKLILSGNAMMKQPYILQFTADDVIKSFVLLWFGFKLNLWLQQATVSALMLMGVFGLVFRSKIQQREGSTETADSRRVVRTSRSQQQQKYRQQQQQRRQPREQKSIQKLSYPSQKISQSKSTAAASAGQAITPSISQPSEVSTSVEEKPQHLQAIHRLKTRYPNATHAECKRFYVCVKHKEDEAAQRIHSWLQWRSDCGLTLVTHQSTAATNSTVNENREYNQQFIHEDQEIWNEAAKLAVQLETKNASNSFVKLPQILCAYEPQIHTNTTTDLPLHNNLPPRSKDSSRILHILPARIDITLAPAPTYSLACALYLDKRLCRTTTEKITLLCDVRGGRGWANPTPWSMLPFIQCTSSLLGKQYPERLQRFVLFPMPSAAAWIWSAAQKCLDPNTASKVVVVGEEKGKRGLPERMLEFFDEESLRLVEERRRGFMSPPRSVSEECVRAMLSC
jgi:hypothetical protein